MKIKKNCIILTLTSCIFATVALSEHVLAEKNVSSNQTQQLNTESIDEWMPNKYTQQALLEALIDARYLPEKSSVEDITQALLNSIPPGYIDEIFEIPVGQLNVVIDAAKEGAIGKDTFKGLEYLTNGTIYASLINFTESQFNLLSWKNFPSNGYKEEGKTSNLTFDIVNEDGRISSEIYNTLNHFANNPQGHFERGALTYFMLANGNPIGTLDLSNESYQTILIKDSDYYNGPIDALGKQDLSMYIYDKVNHNREFIPIYTFTHNDTLHRWEGVYNPSYAVKWNKIRTDPQRYMLYTQLSNDSELMFTIGTQAFDFK